jgi:hypothetical protein
MADKDDGIVREAVLSKDEVYRYVLRRTWGDPAGKKAVWIMLNPSTADAYQDDPTVRRCIGYSKDWGMDGLVVVNLFPLRATDPNALRRHVEPVEVLDQNMQFLDTEVIFEDPAIVLCAWGVNGAIRRRDKMVVEFLLNAGARLNVLRLTEDNHPQHPLYLPKLLKPTAWNGKGPTVVMEKARIYASDAVKS